MPVVRHAVLCSILAVSGAAQGMGWRSLQTLPQHASIDQGVVWWGEQDRLQVSLVDEGVMRVRYAPQANFGRDHSWAVLPITQTARAEVVETEGATELRSAAIHAHIQHAPLRVAFRDAEGVALDADDPLRGIAVVGGAVRVWKSLQANDQVYGFGQKNGRLNKRGWSQGGYHYTMWNSDTFAYDSSTDPTYVSVPFYLVLREGRAYGVYFDNTHRSSFDIGRESPDLLSFGATGGELDYYFIAGPTPKDVIARYTRLTGRMPMPPRWALGFHQSRWSYHPASKLQWIADTFRAKRIPADTLWLDIDYQQDFKPFTWDRAQFPDPAGLIGGLREQGFRVVTIVDAHPPLQPGYPVYDEGHAGGHFVTRPDGSEFSGPVWPSQASADKRDSVFPDFTRASTRDWWGGLYASLLDLGVAGIWNDMNEPSVWIKPAWTMPLDLRHDNDGQPTDHAEAHNVYGMLNTRSTFEGLQRLRPDSRPFVLTRATFAGGQRYAAVWPGDNTADWSASPPTGARYGSRFRLCWAWACPAFRLSVRTSAALRAARVPSCSRAGCRPRSFHRLCVPTPSSSRRTRSRGPTECVTKQSIEVSSKLATSGCRRSTTRWRPRIAMEFRRCDPCFLSIPMTPKPGRVMTAICSAVIC